jgi:DNA-binding transcriptional ArsR family regulator
VERAPGAGAREAQRIAGTGWGETTYHLERLTIAGLIHRERGGAQDHYFASKVPLADRRLLGLCRSVSARHLMLALLEAKEEATVPELVARTGLSEGRISVHLRRLVETGVVRTGRNGRLRTFFIEDRDRVVRLLIVYRDGFADQWVERLLAAWSDLLRP